jgi:hypothetical protein
MEPCAGGALAEETDSLLPLGGAGGGGMPGGAFMAMLGVAGGTGGGGMPGGAFTAILGVARGTGGGGMPSGALTAMLELATGAAAAAGLEGTTINARQAGQFICWPV